MPLGQAAGGPGVWELDLGISPTGSRNCPTTISAAHRFFRCGAAITLGAPCSHGQTHMDDNTKQPSLNRDPISGAPGAHPVGVGIGAAAGGLAAGAAAGTVAAGPVGTVVGAAVGAVIGGLGGKAVAEHFDPTSKNSTGAVTTSASRTISGA